MKRSQHDARIMAPLFTTAIALLFVALTIVPIGVMNGAAADDRDDAGARKAFLEASGVLLGPRCLNCHPSGDAPTTYDDSRPHRFNVKRGPEGKGQGGLVCIRCHKDTNQPDGRPGVVNWHMPPERMPLVFQGRTAGGLCRQLKDPGQNGGRTGEQVIEHMNHDPLVLWSWDPGIGRTPPAMSHRAFMEKMQEWVKKGGDCPE